MSPIHVIPVNDHIDHEADDDCLCGPTPDPVKRDDGSMGWVVIHHSLATAANSKNADSRSQRNPNDRPH